LIVARSAAAISIGILPGAIYLVLRFHRPWWDAVSVTVLVGLALAAVSAFVVFYAELFLRPILDDVASHLPPDFKPSRRGMSLRTKVFAPMPLITVVAATIVGAYGNLSSDRNVRAAIIIAVALVAVAMATLIYLTVLRSILSPMDDLVAATERVSAGDIATPVPVLSSDELGNLAHSFNDMLADLRERTDELEASRAHLRKQADELAASRQRIVTAADAERRRMERDLHDGAQQRLVLLGLKLAMAQRLVETDANAKQVHDELRAELELALKELRDLAHGIYPAVLESEGLLGALSEVVQRSPIPTELHCDGIARHAAEVEAALYFCCLEALQNAAKHAGESARATVRLSESNGALCFRIADNGAGFDARLAPRSAGIQNMTDRIGALGGTLEIHSSPGSGTVIDGRLPIG
jgi:signal transduction histidine kinase